MDVIVTPTDRDRERSSSRPPSPMSTSLIRASASVDELTLTLEGFSRAQTPEPHQALTCCGGHDPNECDHLRAWTLVKAKLESRLILSAQVGQALLQKYEAYVRRHETFCRLSTDPEATTPDHDRPLEDDAEALSREDELIRKNAALEKSLAQALVNAEVTESSNNTLLQELQEARAAVTRLSAHHARSLGWEARLKSALHERDDLQQERDSLLSQARVADQRTNVLKDKCSKLQMEVRRLQRDVQTHQRHRLELSEEILQEARSRIQTLHLNYTERPSGGDGGEVTKVLESLVADNEDLKRSSLELHSLLQESRDDVRALQQEVEELRAAPPLTNPDRPYLRHRYTNSTHSSILSDVSALHFNPPFVSPTSVRPDLAGKRRRPESMQSFRQHPEGVALITPETASRPLSPLESAFSPDHRYTSFGVHHPVEEEDLEPRMKPKKSLLLLNRSVGVQTDAYPANLSPLPAYMDRLTPGDRSESSSLTDASQAHTLATLLERAAGLLTRMSQADALTLTNRLKRQHLSGTEVVAHLSRTTIDAIVSEAGTLRAHFRSVLEDERASLPAGRKELRALFKLLRDAFAEMGSMRLALNDVILDPAAAERIRNAAMNPAQPGERARHSSAGAGAPGAGGAMGWMAPISKLFGAQATTPPTEGPGGRGMGTGTVRAPPRIVPKQRPALAASTTTVNVEFSGAGVGRAVTNTWKEDAARKPAGALPRGDGPPGNGLTPSASGGSSSASVMGIFAGAPRQDLDPWVVLPRGPAPRRMAGPMPTREVSESATLGRAAALRAAHAAGVEGMNPRRLSRNVDAILDASSSTDTAMDEPPLLQRTLRRRGLSDSSMHSTFTAHGVDAPASPPRSPSRVITGPSGRQRGPPDATGLFGALGKRVASFRFGTPALSVMPERTPSGRGEEGDGETKNPTSPLEVPNVPSRIASPGITSLIPALPDLSKWAATANVDPHEGGVYPRTYRAASDERSRGWMGENPREL